ncbi:hypothetical protein [Streptomyces sp. NBC_01304]|uniref:hypothetical protein n=1 Tax=Streptomyces sp. NBC_01304 TaxID=2903818 RepID=UPI002E151520|nr:hypothetical protein OG430_01660 [Streptomyces sp. NBC_01304]
MGSLIGELEAREAAARARVETLEAELAQLTARLEDEREAWSRLRITRETAAEVIMDLDGSGATAPAAGGAEPENRVQPGVRVVGAITVPHWRQGLSAAVLPDVYPDIIEVLTDAAKPMQAKQIVPRIGLPAVTGKIEGTRGKLKRLVERGWLTEDEPGRFTVARPGDGVEPVNSHGSRPSASRGNAPAARRSGVRTDRFARIARWAVADVWPACSAP